MNLGISALYSLNKSQSLNYKTKKKSIKPTFSASKHNVVRRLNYVFLLASMFPVASCFDIKKQKSDQEPISVVSKINETDSSYSSVGEYHYNNDKVKKYYHYYPKEEVAADKYDWSETIYPDGRIEKDSMGYKIQITPEGERTVVHSETTESGEVITTTIYPDGSKRIHTEYKMNNSHERLYVENLYWQNGNLKENKIYNEYLSNYSDKDSAVIILQGEEKYNENGVLISWESNMPDSVRNESNNIYDKQNRLIYDDVKNEKYQYKGRSKTPYRSISTIEDCKRITLYNDDGSVIKVYFKASDGTITEK